MSNTSSLQYRSSRSNHLVRSINHIDIPKQSLRNIPGTNQFVVVVTAAEAYFAGRL